MSSKGAIPTAQEFSSFVQQSQAIDVDYALGLCPADSLDVFRAKGPDETGISVAYFNVWDGRFRQNNLHYARPGRIGRLDRIEEMYELRYQRRFWNMFTLAIRILAARVGGFKIALLFGMMHVAGIADRNGYSRLARLLARTVTLEINQSTISRILDTRFAFVITESGGCGLDIDTEEEYDAVRERFVEWSTAQRMRAETLYGPVPAQLEERTS
jgi:hypothetical protein